MSNYTITTDFGAKDSLPSSNSAKVVRGSEFTTEFTNIQTAIATKADISGSANISIDRGSSSVNLTLTGANPEIILNDSTNTNTCSIQNVDGSMHYRADEDNEFGNSRHRFYTDGTQRMEIEANGNVGIGTDSPTALLHLESASAPTLKIDDSDSTLALELSQDGADGSMLLKSAGTLSIGVTNNSASDTVSFQTQSTERMRIDASGNVGIGTSNPATFLDVNSGALDKVATFTSTDATAFIQIEDGSTTSAIHGYGANGNNLSLYSNGSEKMRIDSSGNVGIGTTSPTHELTVGDANAETTIGVAGNRSQFGFKSDLTVVQGGSGKGIQFNVNNNTFGSGEAMRIDSSGNVLVGKTSDDNTANGLVVSSNGYTKIVRTSGTENANTVLMLNRKSTDGSIAEFRKDDAVVGSIGTSGGEIYIAHDGTTDTGLRFRGNGTIIPVNSNGTGANGTQDLGASLYRFKDLHLSGGVHLGGTGSANKLDDYEEGTWTPTVYANDNTTQLTDGVHYNLKTASYTKIGQLVHLVIRLEDIRSTKDDFNFSVPFTSFDNDLVVGSTLGQDIGSESNTSPIFGRASGRFEIRKDDYQFAYGTCQYRTNS